MELEKMPNKNMNLELDNMQDKNMNLVLLTDAKPRLKWSPELHQRFVEAVDQLGGADKATPKSLMRVMGIQGLTLYHLKSHLQKYRLGKSQQYEYCIHKKKADYRDIRNQKEYFSREYCSGDENHESLHIAKALQLQMNVQRKLHQQIEVQRRLQLRIEAQGRYLQTVLKKAQESFSGHSYSPGGTRKAELQLVSITKSEAPSPSFSELTEVGSPTITDSSLKQKRSPRCSMKSSLTSSENSARTESGDSKPNSTIKHPLLDINLEKELCKGNRKLSRGHKRRGSTISECDWLCSLPGEESSHHTGKNKLRIHEAEPILDLNSQYQDDINPGPIELNQKSI